MTGAVVEEVRSKSLSRPLPGADCASPLRVLLANDEIDQLLPLADVLRHAGLAPTITTSDEELLFEIEMSPPDVVVLDAETVDRGLLSRLRALTPTLPVVLTNAAARHDATWKAMLATVGVACIEKPIDARRLLDLLSDARRFPPRFAQ